MKHRIKILISILFVVATLTTSLHEMLPGHDSTECQVCTLIQNDIGLTPDIETVSTVHTIQFSIPLALQNQTKYHQTTTLGSRAPPLFS